MSVTCPGFVPHGVKPNRCRKCFRDISEHKSETRENIGKKSQDEKATTSVTLPLPRRRREVETVGRTRSEILKSVGRSIDSEVYSSSLPSARSRSGSGELRSRSLSLSDDGQAKVNKSSETEESDVTDSETTDSTSSDEVVLERSEPDGASEKTEENESEEKKAKRIKIVAAKEVDKQLLALSDNSIEGTSPDVEFILHVKTSVKKKNEGDSESVAATETTEATETTLVFQENLEDLQSTIVCLKKQVETLEEKCSRIEREKKDLIQKRAVSEADKRALDKTASELLKLRTKISEIESKNEELNKENKTLKTELKETKTELNKREPPEQVELRFNMLQDKLHQTETLCEDLMEENDEIKKEVRKLEVELEELHDNFREDQASEFRDLKRELEAISKSCRVLQFKLRKAEKKCEQLETDKNEVESKLKEIQATVTIDVDKRKMKNLENELKVAKEVYVKMQDELVLVKETNKKLENENDSLRNQITKGGKGSTSAPELSKMVDGTPTNESLLRDLYDGMERENDLREQLNFAEEESKVIRRKLSTLEQENEILMMQLKKMTTSIQGKGKGQDDKEELSVEELRLHLDLSEQEMSVLRRKVDEIEQENDNLQTEIKYLQDKLVNQPLTNVNIPDLVLSDKSSPTSYYEHKMKLLEYEAKELRKKLIDKDKENDRLQTEVQVYRRKASKVIVRSRSLDSDSQVDLKRQLQLVEQEATMLRQKTVDLENENEKLMKDNKRLQLRVSRKPPLDSVGELQVENLELKNKIDLLEKKYSASQEKLEQVMSGLLPPTTIIQEYKPRKESLTESENELIASLKKRLKSEEDENSSIKTRIVELEIENNKMIRDQKKVKDALNYKKKPPKTVRDTVTRMELREIVSELQDEISDLQVTLRGREAFQETMEEELEKYKKEASSFKKELLQKEEKLTEQMDQNKENLETLRSALNSEKAKRQQLQCQLEEFASKQGVKLELLSSIDSLKSERRDLAQKVKKLENDLKSKEKKCKGLQEELDATSTIKEDVSNTNTLLNNRLIDMEKEVKKHKQLLSGSEEKLLIMQTTLDDKNKEMATVRKECNHLKAQIEEERVNLKVVDDRQMEVTGTYLKERDNLKKQVTNLNSENKDLKEKLEQENKDWQNKVKELKIDYDKRKEVAVKEIQDKMKAELKLIEQEEKIAKNKLTELTEKLEKKERMLKDAVDKQRNLNNQFRKDRDEWQSELSDTESKLRSETRKRERLERELDQLKYQKDEELLTSRDKIVQLEREQRKAQLQSVQLQEQEQQIKQLEKDLEKTKSDYDEMTSKYEQLEEDFVGVKSRLVAEKEEIQSKYSSAKQDYNKMEAKMKSLQATYDSKKELWDKERMEFQKKLQDFQIKSKRFETWDQEKQRMIDTVEEKNSLIESYKKEERHLKEERERLRRRLEDGSKKLSELERNERAARSLSVLGRSDSVREDNRAELMAMKENYEGRMASMASELQSMQAQIVSLSRERDQLKEKLQESKKNTKEILTGSLRRDKMEEMAKILSEEEKLKLEDIHDQLDDVLLENKNLKLQYEIDKNSWEIEMSELHSKINQLEEQKLLESTRGSSRAYARTRLELAWEKERNEQVHALTDSKQIMSNLRMKLISAEKQHDKEKHSMKKHLREFKAAVAKEHEEIKKKMSELYKENVASHAAYEKMKTQYEWLWQDRVKMESDREKWKTQLMLCQEAQNKMKIISEDMGKLMNLVKVNTAPEIVSSLERRKSYSNLSIAKSNAEEMKQIADVMKKKMEEIKTIPITIPEEATVAKSFRRAVSVQDVGPKVGRSRGDISQRLNPVVPSVNTTIRPPPRQKSLNRKSLSLDHGVGMSNALKIWDSGDESNLSSPSGSQLSLKFGLSHFSSFGYESDTSLPESEYTSYSTGSRSVLGYPESSRYQIELPSRESSVSGSVENVGVTIKPKKTLKEKLKMLRAQSVEIIKPSTASDAAERTSLSSTKTDIEEKERSLRSRISKVLKKPLGRSNSIAEGEQGTVQKTQNEETVSFRRSRHSLVDHANDDKSTRARSVGAESASTSRVSSRSGSAKQTPFSETSV